MLHYGMFDLRFSGLPCMILDPTTDESVFLSTIKLTEIMPAKMGMGSASPPHEAQ